MGDTTSRDRAGKFVASHKWRQDFSMRFAVVVRRKTNKRQKTLKERLDLWKKFCQAVLKLICAPSTTGKLDPVRGAFLTHQYLASDQVPLPFVIGDQTTFEEKGAEQVSIVQPGDGLEKRQATIQLLCRAYDIKLADDVVLDANGKPNAEGRKTAQPVEPERAVQAKAAIIFRGKGLRISQQEKDQYHKNVDVYFQPNAWFDTETAIKWIDKTVTNFMNDNFKTVNAEGDEVLDPTIHFLDNLSSQTHHHFRAACKNLNQTLMFYPPGETDNLAPVDAGLGKDVKVEMNRCRDSWLEDGENLEQWMSGKFSAAERRILMCNWLGDAMEVVNKKHYAMYRYFERTGCLQKIDGTSHKISFDGYKGVFDYVTDELEFSRLGAVQMAASGADLSHHLRTELEPAVQDQSDEGNDEEDVDGEGNDEEDVDDELVLVTELEPAVQDQGDEANVDESFTPEERGGDDDVDDGGGEDEIYLCGWSEGIGESFEVAPLDSIGPLGTRALSNREVAYYSDGVGWVLGKIDRKAYGLDDNSFVVYFEDVKQIVVLDPELYYTDGKEVDPSQVQVGSWCLKALTFTMGQVIRAQYLDEPEWYQGVIAAVHEDGTYDINYDDGDSEERKPHTHINPVLLNV